eukprot:TRINITY_DN3300_c0_g1_i3.p1 TRINITY_DN3300_c0_g1~~TRINITY_DN3300_c0_g1_i3.p1  ORF type:complete len:241 (+),score=35.82 TRINITY_DN3300_c0_g1_i3:109-831(+)
MMVCSLFSLLICQCVRAQQSAMALTMSNSVALTTPKLCFLTSKAFSRSACFGAARNSDFGNRNKGRNGISRCKRNAGQSIVGARPKFTTISMAWQECKASMAIDIPASEAWKLWSDRESMTRWMPWISSIKVLKDQPELSVWTLKYNAFGMDLEFSWTARNLQPIPNQKIHWHSLDGLPNRGVVRFYPRGPTSCLVELVVSYEVPTILSGVASPIRDVWFFSRKGMTHLHGSQPLGSRYS